MAQRQVLRDEVRLRAACGTKGAEQGGDDRDHRGRQGYRPPHRRAMETGRFEFPAGTPGHSRRLAAPSRGTLRAGQRDERQVSSPLVVVGKVLLEVPTQRAFVPDDHVVEALPTGGADHPLDERIGVNCQGDRGAVRTASKKSMDTIWAASLARVSASNSRCDRIEDRRPAGRGTNRANMLAGNGIDPRPRSATATRGSEFLAGTGRMRGDVEMDDPSAIVRQHDEYEQDPERGSGDREEVHRGQLRRVIAEDDPPVL
jgi:hypothetical protein